jgi:hypothetical protein
VTYVNTLMIDGEFYPGPSTIVALSAVINLTAGQKFGKALDGPIVSFLRHG